MATTMVQKTHIAPFLNKGTSASPDWVRIRKSTAFSVSMNPETQDFDYIDSESPTTSVKKYKPSLNQAITMYKGEPDYDFVFDKYYNRATGSDAESELLIVYFLEKATDTSKTYYKAEKSACAIAVNELNSVDSTLTCDIYENGDPAKGYVEIDSDGKPTFTEGDFPSGATEAE